MTYMNCPINGPRPESEFICWGKGRPEPYDLCTDESLVEYVERCIDEPGVVTEWWCHRPTNTWFVAMQSRATGQFLTTVSPAGGENMKTMFSFSKSSQGIIEMT